MNNTGYEIFNNEESMKEVYEVMTEATDINLWRFDIQTQTLYDSKKSHLSHGGFSQVLENFPQCIIEKGYIKEEYVQSMRELIKKVSSGQVRAEADIWFKNQSGPGYWCEHITYVNFFDDEGRIVQTIGIGKNITEEANAKIHSHALEMAVASSGVFVGKYNLLLNTYQVYSQKFCKYKVGQQIENAAETFIKEGLVCKDSKKEYLEALEKVKLGTPYVQITLHVMNSLRQERWYNTGFTTLFDETGKAAEAIVCGVNITETKRLEKIYNDELEYQQESDKGDGLPRVRANLSQDLIESYNAGRAAALSRAGASYTDAVQKHIKAAITHEHRQAIKHLCSREALMERFQKGENQWTLEYQRKLNDKRIIWIRVNIKAKRNPETGDIICFFYEENITEQKNVEVGLKALASRNYDFVGIADIKTGRYRSFAKTGVSAVPEKAYDDYNQVTKDLADKLREYFASYEDYIKAREWVSFENVTEHLENADYYTFTFKLQNKEIGETLTYQMVYFYLDKTKEKIVVARSNISVAVLEEQRRQEALKSALLEAELANASKSAFMSRINRDLRTPLDAIIGFAGLSEDIDDVDELKKNLCKIKDSGSFLLEVINDMLHEGAAANDLATLELLEDRKKKLKEYDEILGISLEGKNILLCEDHPLNAEVAQKILGKHGCNVLHAWNGVEALKVFSDSEEYYFDAILMDVQMPLMDGIAVTKQIRKMERLDSSVPIVAMTASAYDTDIEACLGAGMDDHLAKPIDKYLLFQVLGKLMNTI